MDRPEDDRPAAVRDFIAALNEARRRAGRPSLQTLEQLSAKLTQPVQKQSGLRVLVLSDSTTSNILNGLRQGLPKWQWVASFIIVLRVVAAQSGRDPDAVIGTLESWETRYDTADAALQAAPDASGEQRARVDRTAADVAAVDASAAESRRALERGDTGPPAAPTARSAGHVGGDTRWAGMLTLVKQAKALTWWHDHRDIVPDWLEIYLSMEPAAELIQTYEPQFIPGLLQTPDYARGAVLLEHRATPPADIERRVRLRMLRQRILNGPRPRRLWALVEEAALRTLIGGPDVMRDQIRHLIELCARPHVTLQVIGSDQDTEPVSDGRAPAGAPIAILRFTEAELPDLVYLEQPHGALYPDKRIDIDYYRHTFERLAIRAETPSTTVRILHSILTDI
ncbi:hypothetical protein DFJ69_5544 [Thermomonospora umbrina]|uniref:DUF5753 domain-containing protein n=2 Tax=Thermomonospora umbrina TaxID=111806 RepID=A0A3D9T112_9ACTN|nr:hypothetical protein DFJ69_5544 [Thermomonospora umbrina]